MQNLIFTIYTVGVWIIRGALASLRIVWWTLFGSALVLALWYFQQWTAYGTVWWIALGLVAIVEIGFVLPRILALLPGLLYPGQMTYAHGRAHVATLRDVRRSGIWRA